MHALTLRVALAAGLLAGASPTFAQQDLPMTTTYGGITVQDSFYEYLASEIADQNIGRTYLREYDKFTTLTEDTIRSAYDSFEQTVNTTLGSVASICVIFPSICNSATWATILGLVELACGGSFTLNITYIDLGVEDASTFGHFTVESVSISSRPGAHDIDISLSDVGVVFHTEFEWGIGNSCFSAGLIEDEYETRGVYTDLAYRITVDYSGSSPVVTGALLTSLSSASINFAIDGLAATISGDTFAKDLLNRFDLLSPLSDYAMNEVPLRLSEVFQTWWLPYVPSDNWHLDLSAGPQNASYASNVIQGSIDPVDYLTLDAPGDRLHSVFMQGHSTIFADAQAADAAGTFTPSASQPDFSLENTAVDGTFYLSQAAIDHAVLGALRCAVGRRDDNKDGGNSPHRVQHGFANLTPSHGSASISGLLTDPLSALAPVPLSAPQVGGLTTLSSGGLLFGDAATDGVEIAIEVREIDKTYQLPTNDGDGEFGLVWHDVYLDVEVFSNADVWMTESYRALFASRLTMQHNRRRNRNELSALRTQLVSLTNENGINPNAVDGATLVADAPVTLFLKAMFGDRSASPNLTDPYARTLIEALSSPLIGRSAQNVVRLPGLDFERFLGMTHGDPPTPFGNSFVEGLVLLVPPQCAEVQRWGVRAGTLSGTSADQQVFVDVDWIPSNDWAAVDMNTIATSQQVGGGSAGVPSLTDNGYVRLLYSPQTPGDATRMMYASGDRLLPYLTGGAIHYACATVRAYKQLRDDPHIYQQEPYATIELVPYTQMAPIQPDCAFLTQINPAGTMTDHHDGTAFQVWTFESQERCVGPGRCDGERISLYWGAPLRVACGGAQDSYQFSTTPRVARKGPDEYVIDPEICIGDGGDPPPDGGKH